MCLSRSVPIVRQRSGHNVQMSVEPVDDEREERRVLTEISSRNVLVAVDGTPEAWDAVGLGVQIVRASRGRLTLLTVVVPPPAWTQVGLFAPPADGDAERAAEQRLRELADAIPPEIPVTTQLLHGDAAHLIAKQAEQGNHDLVVLAAHEHGPIGAAIESVQRRLLKCTRVPVLAIRRPQQADGPTQP